MSASSPEPPQPPTAKSDTTVLPAEPRPLLEQVAVSALFTTLGMWHATGHVFHLPGRAPRAHTVATMRGFGTAMLGFGLYRGWEAWRLYRQQQETR